MKNVFDRLEQIARERLLTRLKHLRGQHIHPTRVGFEKTRGAWN